MDDKEHVSDGERKGRNNYISNNVGLIFGSIAFIFIIILSWFEDIESTSATIVFSAMLLGKMLSELNYKRKNATKFIRYMYVLSIVGLTILMIGYIGELVYGT